MKKNVYLFALIIITVISFTACGRRNAKIGSEATTSDKEEYNKPLVFLPALAPSQLSAQEKVLYLNEHYWDKFDFADTVFISKIDTARMMTAFAVYVGGCVPDSLVTVSMSRLMTKASASKKMFSYFMNLAETILHDPNSPMRNDELYIPVLETATSSALLDEYEKLPYQYDLDMARQNRVGQKATDIVYTMASGKQSRMYDIQADYLILFISNPGCPFCREVREQIKASPLLNELIERGDLKILVFYPDEDLTAWRKHLSDYPSSWINGYDRGMVVTKNKTYNLKAIPSLYLLDKQKRVMAKDCTAVEYIENLISAAQ